MASLDDIAAATKILSEDPDAKMGGSGSKSKGNRVKASDLSKDDGGGSAAAAAVVVSEPVVDTQTVVESTIDGDSALNRVLSEQEKEKSSVGNVGSVCFDNNSGSANAIDARAGVNGSSGGGVGNDAKGKDGKASYVDNEEDSNTDRRQLNGGGIDGKGEKDDEKLEDGQNDQFRVGDFIWGKIRTHPWWPGQVYDPKDASEFASRSKQKGRLLVAFFGDSSCSWCSPSQLIPFVENFLEMSTKSSSKSFLDAVQRAINEVGRSVESDMTCNCVTEKKKDGLGRPAVENAGVKAGVLVPEVEGRRLSILKYESKELVQKVRQLAKTVSAGNALDLAVLRSWFSAFYNFKGGYRLPVYQDPLSIEGMEDNNKDVNEAANDFSIPIEVPIRGPKNDDWPSSSTVGTVNSPSANKIFHKRKQKSVAELMGGNKNTGVKSISSKKKKNNDGGTKEAGNKVVSSTEKTGRMRKVEVSKSSNINNEKGLNAENGYVGTVDGVNIGPKDIKATDAENTSQAKEESEPVSTPRERKRSKYLSPPYTNLMWRMGNSSTRTDLEAEYDKITNIDSLGGHPTEPTGECSSPQPLPKSVDKTSERKAPNKQLDSSDISVDTSLQRVEDDKNTTFSVSDVDSPVSQLLSKIQLAAVDVFYLSEEGSLDMIWAFIYALRSSTYLHGPNYKIYQKCKTAGKRKSGPSQLGNDLTQKKVKSLDQNTSGGLKAEGTSDISKSKKAAESSVAKSNEKEVERKTSPCLILEFVPGFPLPSKEDIVKLFGKYGSLNRKAIKVRTDSHSIQIVYNEDSEAEKAFKSSLRKSQFGFENVSYRLQHSSAGSRSGRSHPKVPSPVKRAHDKRKSSLPTSDDLISDARVFKQKVELMTAIMENYLSHLSPEDKSNLKGEMKHLMEKVETVSDEVRAMAENT